MMRIGFGGRGLGRAGALLLTLAAAGACDDQDGVPSTGTEPAGTPSRASSAAYTPVIADDWSAYSTRDDLRRTGYFWWYLQGEDVHNYLDVVPDPTFGKVVRYTFQQSSGQGYAPKSHMDFPRPLDKMWLRWRMKYTPGWSTAGPLPSGYANSYKVAFWLWDGYGSRGSLEISNTDEYQPGLSITDNSTGSQVRYSESKLPNSQDFGRVTSEWSDNEWYEFVAYYEKTGPTSARQHWWRRKLTQGGTVVSNPWVYAGVEITGATTPRVRAIRLGETKNKNNPQTQYLSWGPWEVVDGSQYANPWNMPNVSGGSPNPAPSSPTLTRVDLTPSTATVATGGTQQFQATGRMSDGSTSSVQVTFAATGGSVNGSGLYTAGSTAGTFRVIATAANGMADTSTVSVTASQPTVTAVTLTPGNASTPTGGTVQFSASATRSDGSTGAVQVTYAATGGSVSSAGLYTAGSTAGTFRVVATAANGMADTAAVTVTQPAPTVAKVTLSPGSASVQTGRTVQFSAAQTMSDGSTGSGPVTFAATGGSINGAGLYTAGSAAGTFRVVATAANGMADTAAVTVTQPAPTVTKITISPASVSLQTGGTQQFSATQTLSDGSTGSAQVTYAATGGSISSSGRYTAGSTAGTFRVIATGANGKADTAAVTVTSPPPPPPPSSGGSFQTLAGADWSRFSGTSALGEFYSGNDLQNVALVSDPTFGKAVRMTQAAGSTASPTLEASFGPTAKVWYRWRMKLEPGWTADGSGSGASYWGVATWRWQDYLKEGGLVVQNGRFAPSFSVMDRSTYQYVRHQDSPLPGSASDLGAVEADGEWYEFVAYYEKTGATTARQHWWKRRLTRNGSVAPGGWTYFGISLSGEPTPEVRAVQLGLDRSKAPTSDQHVLWGPWEVVDGSRNANPFGMPMP